MTILHNFVWVMGRYAVFEGRASRSEYWWFFPVFVVMLIFIDVAFSLVGLVIFSAIIRVGFLVPFLAVTTRRLHDIGRSAWWLIGYAPYWLFTELISIIYNGVLEANEAIWIGVGLIALVAIVCNIVMLVFMVRPSNQGENRYGAPP